MKSAEEGKRRRRPLRGPPALSPGDPRARARRPRAARAPCGVLSERGASARGLRAGRGAGSRRQHRLGSGVPLVFPKRP